MYNKDMQAPVPNPTTGMKPGDNPVVASMGAGPAPTAPAAPVAQPTGLLATRQKRGPSALRKGLNNSPIRTMRDQLANPNLDPQMRMRMEREMLRQGGTFAKGYDAQMNGGAVNRYQAQYQRQNQPPMPPPPMQQPNMGQQVGNAWGNLQPQPGGLQNNPGWRGPSIGKQGIPQQPSQQPFGPGNYQNAFRGR